MFIHRPLFLEPFCCAKHHDYQPWGRRGLTWLVLTGDGPSGGKSAGAHGGAQRLWPALFPLTSMPCYLPYTAGPLSRIACSQGAGPALTASSQEDPRGDVHSGRGSSSAEAHLTPGVKLTTSLFVKIGHSYGWLISVRIIWLICSSFKNDFIVWVGFQVLGKKKKYSKL